MEFAGAMLVGSRVTDTIRTKVISTKLFEDVSSVCLFFKKKTACESSADLAHRNLGPIGAHVGHDVCYCRIRHLPYNCYQVHNARVHSK
jgi:hypothetical protein